MVLYKGLYPTNCLQCLCFRALKWIFRGMAEATIFVLSFPVFKDSSRGTRYQIEYLG